MSRHRAVRGRNLDDEYDDEDDYYGHSVEDNFCISPGTAAQFTFNRGQHTFGSYMGDERVEEESEEEAEAEESSPGIIHNQLNPMNQAKLNSCLEEIHNILGETRPDSVYTETVIKHNYNLQAALDELLSLKEAPKPQRAPRQNRRNQSQGDSDDGEDDISDPDNMLSHSLVSEQLSREGGMTSVSSKTRIADNDSKLVQSNLSLSDLAKGHHGQLGLKMKKDWLQNNVCESSNIPHISGLTQSLGHMKVNDSRTKDDAEEVFESKAVGVSLNERKLLLDSSGRSPKSSLSSSAGSESGLSLSQLASLHHQQQSVSPSLAELAIQRTRQPTSGLSVLQDHSKMKVVTPQAQKISLSSGATSSLSELASNNQQKTISANSTGLSLADLAKQHSTTGMSLSELAESRRVTSGQGFQKLADLQKQKPNAASTASAGSGLSLAHLANTQKSGPLGLGSLAQSSSSSGISLAALANTHSKSGQGILQSGSKSSDQTSSLSKLFTNKVPLSKIQFSSEERTPSPEIEMSDGQLHHGEVVLLTPVKCDDSLLSVPSVLGKALCLIKIRKRGSDCQDLKYPKFAYNAQTKRCKYQSPLHKRQIKVFDFSTPSPDDLVKQKQKGAFTRTGERHLSS